MSEVGDHDRAYCPRGVTFGVRDTGVDHPMPLRPCLTCGRLTSKTRCERCQRGKDRAKWAARPLPYVERQRRTKAVAEHRERYGDWCPGLPPQRPAHRVAPPNLLTADHVDPVALGGSEAGRLVVRCRDCNSAKSARRSG